MAFTKEEIEIFGNKLIKELNDIVFNNIYNYIRENPAERKSLNPAFPFPKKVRIGILDNVLAIEYIGPEEEQESEIPIEIRYDESMDLFAFLGVSITHLKPPIIGNLDDNIVNMNFFLGESVMYLTDYFYDFMQIPEDTVLNGIFDSRDVQKPCVINNCTFFYTDQDGGLKIKHCDLVEVFPRMEGNILYHTRESLLYFSNYIISNKVPAYDIELHKKLNKFIELINLAEINEPQITKYIAEHPPLLQIAFGFKKLNPQKTLKWQDGSARPNLKPDFLPESLDGYCNILDFKLPYLKSKPIVGKPERKHPSYEIDECIAQLDSYEEYCTQSVNKAWLQKTYSIKIEAPVRYIIMGHSKDFSAEDRQKIRRLRNTSFFTYDEFIEMARYQIYRIK